MPYYDDSNTQAYSDCTSCVEAGFTWCEADDFFESTESTCVGSFDGFFGDCSDTTFGGTEYTRSLQCSLNMEQPEVLITFLVILGFCCIGCCVAAALGVSCCKKKPTTTTYTQHTPGTATFKQQPGTNTQQNTYNMQQAPGTFGVSQTPGITQFSTGAPSAQPYVYTSGQTAIPEAVPVNVDGNGVTVLHVNGDAQKQTIPLATAVV